MAVPSLEGDVPSHVQLFLLWYHITVGLITTSFEVHVFLVSYAKFTYLLLFRIIIIIIIYYYYYYYYY